MRASANLGHCPDHEVLVWDLAPEGPGTEGPDNESTGGRQLTVPIPIPVPSGALAPWP